jgi:hypothetical protein
MQAANGSASRNPGPHAVVELSTVGSPVPQAVQQHPARFFQQRPSAPAISEDHYRAIPGARAFPVLPATKRSPLWHHGCEAEIDGMLVWRCAYCE